MTAMRAALKPLISAVMVYVIVAGAAGIVLKTSYPPYHLCETGHHGAVDAYCPAIDSVSAPAMGLLLPSAVVVRCLWDAGKLGSGDWLFVGIAALLGLPLILLVYGNSRIWHPSRPAVANAMALLVGIEVIWDGLTGIYGIT